MLRPFRLPAVVLTSLIAGIGSAHASETSNRLREDGVLIGTDGPYHNVLKIRPPMPFDKDDADALVRSLDKALAALAS